MKGLKYIRETVLAGGEWEKRKLEKTERERGKESKSSSRVAGL
jgi:hypothetical protein